MTLFAELQRLLQRETPPDQGGASHKELAMFLAKNVPEPTTDNNLFSAPPSPEVRRAKEWLQSRLNRAKKVGTFFETGTLTPELAELIIALNEGNRPFRVAYAAKLAETMKAGAWKLTHQGMAITLDGLLNDGQHRATACVMAGVPIPMTFCFGVSRDTFDVLDVHAKRGGGDVLSIAGEKHWNTLASLANAILWHELRDGRKGNVSLRNDEIAQFIAAHPQSRRAAAIGQGLAGPMKIAPTPAALGAYLCLVKRPAATETFFEQLRTGLGLTHATDPVYVTRQHILNNYTRTTRRPGGGRYDMAACIVKGFNAYVAGSRIKTVIWKANERFPEVA